MVCSWKSVDFEKEATPPAARRSGFWVCEGREKYFDGWENSRRETGGCASTRSATCVKSDQYHMDVFGGLPLPRWHTGVVALTKRPSPFFLNGLSPSNRPRLGWNAACVRSPADGRGNNRRDTKKRKRISAKQNVSNWADQETGPAEKDTNKKGCSEWRKWCHSFVRSLGASAEGTSAAWTKIPHRKKGVG